MIVINWNDESLEKRLWSETSLFMLRVLHLKNIFREIISSIKQGFRFIAFLYQIRKYINLYRWHKG